jgi:hypothetical protein
MDGLTIGKSPSKRMCILKPYATMNGYGTLAACCTGSGLDAATLRAAGLGQAL